MNTHTTTRNQIGWTKMVVLTGIGLALALAPVKAGELTLTNYNATGTINGAVFTQISPQSTGTGVIDPFLREDLSGSGVEQGYNTSGSPLPFDDKTPYNYTHDLSLSSLAVTNVLGTDYYSFVLDINQSKPDTLLSLDEVQIFTTSVGSQTTTNFTGGVLALQSSTLRYDLNSGGSTDNWVLLNYALNSGSGSGDMQMMVPVDNFAGASSNDFMVLYAKFGVRYVANDGFEEWNASVVPEPSSVALVLGALALGFVFLRRRQSC